MERIPEKLIKFLLKNKNLFVEEIENISAPDYPFRYSVTNIRGRNK